MHCSNRVLSIRCINYCFAQISFDVNCQLPCDWCCVGLSCARLSAPSWTIMSAMRGLLVQWFVFGDKTMNAALSVNMRHEVRAQSIGNRNRITCARFVFFSNRTFGRCSFKRLAAVCCMCSFTTLGSQLEFGIPSVNITINNNQITA